MISPTIHDRLDRLSEGIRNGFITIRFRDGVAVDLDHSETLRESIASGREAVKHKRTDCTKQ